MLTERVWEGDEGLERTQKESRESMGARLRQIGGAEPNRTWRVRQSGGQGEADGTG